MHENRPSIPTCCVTGGIPGDGGACGDCDPCVMGEAIVPEPVKRLIAEKNSLLNQIGEMGDEIERLRAFPEQCAAMIEGYTAGQIKMAAGEMTAQEMRTVRAVQRWWAAAIRHRFCGGNEQASGKERK